MFRGDEIILDIGEHTRSGYKWRMGWEEMRQRWKRGGLLREILSRHEDGLETGQPALLRAVLEVK